MYFRNNDIHGIPQQAKLRDALLPKLLSSELRVPTAGKEAD
jgi:hypothetical protein